MCLSLTRASMKLTKTQIVLIAVGCTLAALTIIAVGMSFYPFGLKDSDRLQLYQLMKDVDEILTRANVSYIVESGTLLGCVRHKGLIPWDDDLDIQVMHKDEKAFLALKPLFLAVGFDIRPAPFGWRIQPNVKRPFAFPFCDVFITSFDSKSYTRNKNHSFEKCKFHVSEYYPIRRYDFGAITVNGPAQGELFLDRCYGDTWRDTWYKMFSHKFLYFQMPSPKKMKPDDYKAATPTGPLIDRDWDALAAAAGKRK